jgi:NAD(P)H-binding
VTAAKSGASARPPQQMWSPWLRGDARGRDGGRFPYSLGFHLLLGRVYEDKDVQEWIVRRSKLDWVIVRPVILTDGPKTNAYRALVDPRDWTCGFISRADVADFLC